MSIDVICIGSALQEIIYNTHDASVLKKGKGNHKKKYIAFDFGSKISSNKVFRSFGGGAINSSVNLNRMGVQAAPLSVIGNDLSGRAIEYYLKKKGVSRKLIHTDDNHQTAFSFVLNLPSADEHILFVSQAVLTQFKFKHYSLKRFNPSWLYITSLRGDYADYNIRDIFYYAQRNEINIFWNPGQQQLDNFERYKKYFSQVDFLSLNKQEAQTVMGRLGSRKRAASSMAQELLDLGIRQVVITQGKQGVYYANPEQTAQQASNKVKVINTTGAGDAFNSGFLAGYISSHHNIETALQAGVDNASAVIQTIGAHQGGLTKQDLKAYA